MRTASHPTFCNENICTVIEALCLIKPAKDLRKDLRSLKTELVRAADLTAELMNADSKRLGKITSVQYTLTNVAPQDRIPEQGSVPSNQAEVFVPARTTLQC